MATTKKADDPAIRRVRDARHTISEEHGHDPKRLVAYYMKRQRKQKQKSSTKQ